MTRRLLLVSRIRFVKVSRHTANTDDKLPAGDPGTHAQQNLMPWMEMIERPSKHNIGVKRWQV